MHAPKLAKIDVFRWIAILPQIAGLVGEVVDALRDGHVDAAEVVHIGERLVAIVSAVV